MLGPTRGGFLSLFPLICVLSPLLVSMGHRFLHMTMNKVMTNSNHVFWTILSQHMFSWSNLYTYAPPAGTPQTLRTLCVVRVRECLGSRGLREGLSSLRLPPPVTSCILLQDHAAIAAEIDCWRMPSLITDLQATIFGSFVFEDRVLANKSIRMNANTAGTLFWFENILKYFHILHIRDGQRYLSFIVLCYSIVWT